MSECGGARGNKEYENVRGSAEGQVRKMKGNESPERVGKRMKGRRTEGKRREEGLGNERKLV